MVVKIYKNGFQIIRFYDSDFKIQAKKVSPLYSPLLLPMYRAPLTVILATV